MSRLFSLAFLLVPVAARAADPAPELLLSPTSQLYARWDGVTAHAETYKKSFWGPLMAGPTGDSLRALLAKVPKLLGSSLLAEPLLDGKPPAELKANLADLKNASKLLDLLADKGALIGAEVREPKPSLKGLRQALGGLFGGKDGENGSAFDSFTPDVQILAIVPDVGDKSEVLFATLRLAINNGDSQIVPFAVGSRKGFKVKSDDDNEDAKKRRAGGFIQLPVPEVSIDLQMAWWLEGKHFVLYIGTMKPETMMEEVAANSAKGGVTGHPLFVRCQQETKFTSVARGFVDAGKVVSLVKSLAGPLVPGLNQRLDDLGFGNLKAILFNCGYDGKEFRAVWDLDLPGERKGFAKVLKGGTPIGLKDLPPLPVDVNRFLAVRLDPGAAFDAGINTVELLAAGNEFGVEDESNKPAENIRLRREYLAKEFDKLLALSVKDEILPCLGDKLVVYQSPNEGLAILGTVVCVSLKDPVKAKSVGDRIHRGIESIIGTPVKVRKKMLKGVEVRELYSRGFGIVTPTFAIVDDWLVVSLYPQGVQGMILRMKGELPAWKPDAETARRIAKLPADGCSLQYCDPTSTVKNLCTLGPLLLNVLGLRDGGDGGDSDYDPLDVGLIPNAHELSKHLFPNLTVIRDDGKTVRIEVNESISLPLEVIGLESLIFGGVLGGIGLGF